MTDAQSSPAPTLTGDEVAALLHMTPAWFARRRHKMIAEGMPRPVPGAGLLWSRRNIMAWIDGTLVPAELEDAR